MLWCMLPWIFVPVSVNADCHVSGCAGMCAHLCCAWFFSSSVCSVSSQMMLSALLCWPLLSGIQSCRWSCKHKNFFTVANTICSQQTFLSWRCSVAKTGTAMTPAEPWKHPGDNLSLTTNPFNPRVKSTLLQSLSNWVMFKHTVGKQLATAACWYRVPVSTTASICVYTHGLLGMYREWLSTVCQSETVFLAHNDKQTHQICDILISSSLP